MGEIITPSTIFNWSLSHDCKINTRDILNFLRLQLQVAAAADRFLIELYGRSSNYQLTINNLRDHLFWKSMAKPNFWLGKIFWPSTTEAACHPRIKMLPPGEWAMMSYATPTHPPPPPSLRVVSNRTQNGTDQNPQQPSPVVNPIHKTTYNHLLQMQ